MEGRPLDDATLVEQARRGDDRAYEELVLRYQDLAFRAAYLITGEATEAEDVTQEAFVKAYRALPRFRDGSPFRPWLLRIVANEARNRRLSIGRRAGLRLRLAATYPGDSTESSPEAVALADERRVTLLHAIRRLSPADQLVITYRYFLDLSEAEMATVLDCPKGTVKSRVSRAVGRLRTALVTSEESLVDVGVTRD